ncbi:UNVERIFIED_ORG: ABC-type proline/glycine betaine transport system substrate-binding protein [Rhizobium sp. SLBN-170]
MKKWAGVFSAAMVLTTVGTSALASDAETCKVVRLAEPGWNDLAFTTGIAMSLLKSLGYEPQSQLLGIDVIYTSLKSKDLDVFLGYWNPAMVNYYKPYKEDGSVEKVRTNLVGAKYTFAVPTYVWDAGVRDFSDLQKIRGQVRQQALRHRTGLQPVDAGCRQRSGTGTAQLGSGRVQRTGHAFAGNPFRPQQVLHCFPGVGAAPDEQQIRHQVPDGRR